MSVIVWIWCNSVRTAICLDGTSAAQVNDKPIKDNAAAVSRVQTSSWLPPKMTFDATKSVKPRIVLLASLPANLAPGARRSCNSSCPSAKAAKSRFPRHIRRQWVESAA